jgi:glycosyltransferase involved in cell wall biosynthesis
MKRNLFIISGSGDTFVWFRMELIQEFINCGYCVCALAPNISASSQQILSAQGVEFIQIGMQRKSFNILNFVTAFFEIIKLYWRYQPEIVLPYMHKPILLSSLAAIFFPKIKVYPMITGLGHLFERESLKFIMIRNAILIFFKIAFLKASKIFFQNPDDLELFLYKHSLLPQVKGILIPGSGVNTEKYKVTPLPENPVFMTMARLLESKGLREFAMAAKIVRSRFPNARFLLYGYPDPHDDAISEKEISQTWYDEYGVEYKGFAEHPVEAISSCSIFVLLSYREGTPRTVLESMSMGRPVITTDVPGCRETTIESFNGFLVQSHNADSAAQAMEMLCDSSLRNTMGINSRALAEQKFDVHMVNRIILKAMKLG